MKVLDQVAYSGDIPGSSPELAGVFEDFIEIRQVVIASGLSILQSSVPEVSENSASLEGVHSDAHVNYVLGLVKQVLATQVPNSVTNAPTNPDDLALAA